MIFTTLKNRLNLVEGGKGTRRVMYEEREKERRHEEGERDRLTDILSAMCFSK